MSSPDYFIACGGLSPDRPDGSALSLDLSKTAGPQSRIELKLESTTRQLADNIPAVLADSLEIATYVYSADRLIRRTSPCMDRMNAGWRRSLRFRIPVRAPSLWARREIREALAGTLSFLSDDYFAFEFVQAAPEKGIQPYLGFRDTSAHTVQPDEVMLFSGGLDSLGGVVDSLIRHQRKMVLVSHQSATQVSAVQNELVQMLGERVGPRRVGYVPVWVTKGKGGPEPVEFTQRTRSFLFITLGVTIARMYGLDRVEIAENGVTSFNLPISEQAIGTLASRTTHPRVLSEFGRLFSLLLDRPIHINNRFIWSTKAEVVRSIADNDAADLISRSTSCAAVRSQSFNGKPCGVCSQCIERRFSIAAAGLEEIEAAEAYAIDLFAGAVSRIQDLTMVEQFILRAHRHKGITTEDFLASYGQVFRALPYLAGKPDENAYKIAHLYRRHGAAVTKILNAKLTGLDFDATLALPPNSLLAMIRPSNDLNIRVPDPIRNEPVPSREAAADRSVIRHIQFVMAVDPQRKCILFDDGPVIRSKVAYGLLARLAMQHEEDLRARLPLKRFRFIKTKTLISDLKAGDEPTLRKRVERVRKQLQQLLVETFGYEPDRNDIIQSVHWGGYRLNPYVQVVTADQVNPADEMSRAGKENVTSQPRPH